MGIWTGAPRTWVTGDALNGTNLNANMRDPIKALADPMTSYTPVWTAGTTNPSVNNGSFTGAYTQVGKHVEFRVILVFGSTTSAGVGNYFFTLPVVPNVPAGAGIAAGGYLIDVSSSARRWAGVATFNTAGAVILIDASTGNPVSNIAPWTWANGDIITFAGTYEAA